MVVVEVLSESDRTLLIEMFCCVIAADKKISGREVQVVVDTLAGIGCKPSGSDLKSTVVDFCKAIHKRGVDAYVADLLPRLTSKSSTPVAQLFIDAQKTLLQADGQATSDEQVVSDCLVTALKHPVAVDCEKEEADVVLEEPAPSGKAVVSTAAKSAVAIAGAAAERTRLLTITLPAAYLGLGKHCAEQRLFCQEFPDIYAALSTVAAEIAATSEKLSQSSSATTLAGKAQEIAGKGVRLALSKKQALQQQKLLHDLGKKLFETKGINSGPPELTKKIAQIKERIAVLGESVGNSAQALKQSASALTDPTPNSGTADPGSQDARAPWKVATAIALCFPLGLYWLWKHSLLRANKGWWTCVALYPLLVGIIGASQDYDKRSEVRQEEKSGDAKNTSRQAAVSTIAGRIVPRIAEGMLPQQVRAVCGQGPSTVGPIGLGEGWVLTFSDESKLFVAFSQFGTTCHASELE